jgi:hypothetical protein
MHAKKTESGLLVAGFGAEPVTPPKPKDPIKCMVCGKESVEEDSFFAFGHMTKDDFHRHRPTCRHNEDKNSFTCPDCKYPGCPDCGEKWEYT